MSMISYPAEKAPIHVFGLPLLYETGQWRKLPEFIIRQIPRLDNFRRITSNARVCFRTDAPEFTLRCRMSTCNANPDHSALSLSGLNVYVGETRTTSRYLSFLSVPTPREEVLLVEKTFSKGSGMEEVMILLPSRCYMESMEILVDESAKVEPPTPYRIEKPIVFYGSSITAGGAASRAGNSYISLLSRWLDADVLNFGFAGNARGELPMAEYLKNIEMSVFVYDYDHNAQSPEELRQTHKPFFDVIRKHNPELPIIMLTRPCGDLNPEDTAARREVVYDTYRQAVEAGDRKVWYINGRTLLGEEDRHACTVDLIHPNDLGFMRMAKRILPVLREALGEQPTE